MLISKYNQINKNTNEEETKITIVLRKSSVQECKNKDYIRFTLFPEYIIGLDNKGSITAKELLNLDKIPLNNAK